MESAFPQPIEEIVSGFSSLPGIGPKSAQRIAFYLLQQPGGESSELLEAIAEALRQVKYCESCFNFAISEQCDFCIDEGRNTGLLCVVEDPRDVLRIEGTGEFKGRYHVLGGAINSMDGVGPDQLRIKELFVRIKDENIQELLWRPTPTQKGSTRLFILPGI